MGEVWAESGGAVQLFEDRDLSKAAARGGVRPGPCVGSGPRPSVNPGGRAKLWTWSGFTQASCLDRGIRERLSESKNHSIMG